MNRYCIDDLTVTGYPVWYSLGQGELIGVLALTARGKRLYRVCKSQDRPKLTETEDLPRHATPWLWRPVYPDKWPEPLPEPAAVLTAPLDLNAKPSNPAQDGQTHGDPWPRVGLRLGRPGEPPESLLETEARIVHALRTFDVRYEGRADDIGYALCRWLQGGNAWDRSDSTARPAKWNATPRDISDLEAGVLRWMNVLEDEDAKIVGLRAAMPVYSWTQVAGLVDRARSTVIARHQGAVRQMFRAGRLCTTSALGFSFAPSRYRAF